MARSAILASATTTVLVVSIVIERYYWQCPLTILLMPRCHTRRKEGYGCCFSAKPGVFTRCDITIQRVKTHLLDPLPLSLSQLADSYVEGDFKGNDKLRTPASASSPDSADTTTTSITPTTGKENSALSKQPASKIPHIYVSWYTIHSKAPHSPDYNVIIRDRRDVVVVVSRNALNEPRFTHASQFSILSK